MFHFTIYVYGIVISLKNTAMASVVTFNVSEMHLGKVIHAVIDNIKYVVILWVLL